MPEHCVKANAITGFEREATGQGHLISRNLQIADHHLGPLRGATVGRQILAQGVMGTSQKTESMVTPVFATPILTTSWLA